MKYVRINTILFLAIMVICSNAEAAKIKVISSTFETGYSSAVSYNNNFKSKDSIDHAENYGFGIDMRIGQVTKMINIVVGFHYVPMRVSEYDAKTALLRTGYPYAQSYWNQMQTYITKKSADGLRNIFDVKYQYVYHMSYLNALLGIELYPMSTGLFRPFVSAGLAPCKFDQRGYFQTDITGRYEDANGNSLGKYRYKLRNHTSTRNKHRGYIFNGWVTGGCDLMFTKQVGLQLKGRFFKTLHDNKRNRITGYYNIDAGLVFHPE